MDKLLYLNKKGEGELLSTWGFYTLIFAIIFLFNTSMIFLVVQSDFVVNKDLNDIEGSIIGARVIDCLSESSFGILNKINFNENFLLNCYDYRNKYDLELSLISVKPGLDGDAIQIGQLGSSFRPKNYYVLVEDEPYLLEMRWKHAI